MWKSQVKVKLVLNLGLLKQKPCFILAVPTPTGTVSEPAIVLTMSVDLHAICRSQDCHLSATSNSRLVLNAKNTISSLCAAAVEHSRTLINKQDSAHPLLDAVGVVGHHSENQIMLGAQIAARMVQLQACAESQVWQKCFVCLH